MCELEESWAHIEYQYFQPCPHVGKEFGDRDFFFATNRATQWPALVISMAKRKLSNPRFEWSPEIIMPNTAPKPKLSYFFFAIVNSKAPPIMTGKYACSRSCVISFHSLLTYVDSDRRRRIKCGAPGSKFFLSLIDLELVALKYFPLSHFGKTR